METVLATLGALSDPTRLRLLALAGAGTFCVNDFCDILGQSQPRLSRHLRLLVDAGLLERTREGANAWFAPARTPEAALARDIVRRLPESDPQLAADRRQAARVLAERAREASDSFRRRGADWDEMRALGLPAPAVEEALTAALPPGALGRVLDIGTGTGRLLELLAPRTEEAVGVDASRTMLALARVRLAQRPDLSHCAVRLADMYALPLPGAHFDLVLMGMVLHYAEEPAKAVAEARRVLRPGGLLAVVDLAAHGRDDLRARMAHRWLGFSERRMRELFGAAGLEPGAARAVPGPLEIRIWTAAAPALVEAA